MRQGITVVILTYNESMHIRRAIESVRPFATEIIVVDSFSTDDTCAVARGAGARVLQRKFVHQADQLQWAMDNAGIDTTWVMRLDADEYVTPALSDEIHERLDNIPEAVSGIVLTRRVYFMGRWIRYGGCYPVHILRMWRHGEAAVEQRKMDEHVYLLKGRAIRFAEDFVDDNLQTLSWWTEKHNRYATREAAEYLLRTAMQERVDAVKLESMEGSNQASRTRWVKTNVYDRLPLLLRCVLYFHYRYFLRAGFLDGRSGLVWHFLQGFWYRFLVDAKILQVKWIAAKSARSVHEVLRDDFQLPVFGHKE